VAGIVHAVAVVDDDEAVLESTATFLQSLGYDAIPFASAEGYLASRRHADVSHLLTDLDLPGMSGLQLLDIVGTSQPGIVVIVMTGLPDTHLARCALAAGARCLLRKPVPADDLVRCLQG